MKAGCAVGWSILVIVWHLLNDPPPATWTSAPDWHARHTDRSRKSRNARRQIEALGYDVIITLAGRRLMSTSTATLRAPRSSRMISAWAAQAHARSG